MSNRTRIVRATDVFKNFSWIFSLEFLLVTYMMSLLMAVMLCLTKNRPVTADSVLKHFAENVWNILTVVVHQEILLPMSVSLKICWFSLCFIIFVITQGYLYNLISTELVTVIPTPQVDNLEDLEKPENVNLSLTMLKGQVARSYLLAKPLGSVENRILTREYVVDLSNCNMLNEVVKTKRNLRDRLTAFVVSKATFSIRFEMGACMMYPDYGKRRHISRNPFGSGLTTLFSRKFHTKPMAMRYLSYRNRLIIEAGLFKTIWDRVTILAAQEMLNGELNHKTYVCLDGIPEKATIEQRLVDIKMQIWALTTSVYFLACGCFIASIFVILEIDVNRCILRYPRGLKRGRTKKTSMESRKRNILISWQSNNNPRRVVASY